LKHELAPSQDTLNGQTPDCLTELRKNRQCVLGSTGHFKGGVEPSPSKLSPNPCRVPVDAIGASAPALGGTNGGFVTSALGQPWLHGMRCTTTNLFGARCSSRKSVPVLIASFLRVLLVAGHLV